MFLGSRKLLKVIIVSATAGASALIGCGTRVYGQKVSGLSSYYRVSLCCFFFFLLNLGHGFILSEFYFVNCNHHGYVNAFSVSESDKPRYWRSLSCKPRSVSNIVFR